MKKLLSVVILSVLISGSALAGEHGGDRPFGPIAEGPLPMHKLAKVLDLTDEQKSQLKALKEEARDERPEHLPEDSAMFQLSQLDTTASDYQNKVNQLAEQRAEQAREQFLQMADMRAKMEAILTPEQRAKLKTIIEKRKELRKLES